jgi:hypothetical protein
LSQNAALSVSPKNCDFAYQFEEKCPYRGCVSLPAMKQFQLHLKGSKDILTVPADSAAYVRGFLVFKTDGRITAQYPKEETQGWSEILDTATAASGERPDETISSSKAKVPRKKN